MSKSTQTDEPPIQPLAPRLQQLRAEEHRLGTEIRSLEDNWRIFDNARTNAGVGPYKNPETPTLEALWEGCGTREQKSAAIEPEIAKTTAAIEAAKRQLVVVRARLDDAMVQAGELARKEATPPALKTWPDVPLELRQGLALAAEQERLWTAIENEQQRATFWRSARGLAGGNGNVIVESILYERLTFGCFTPEERMQRVDREIADATAKLADFRERDEANEAELERLRRVLLPLVRKECRTRAGKLDAALREAEAYSLGIDAISAAVASMDLLDAAAAGGYLFFRGDRSMLSAFRYERLRKLQAGALEVGNESN